MKKYWFVFFLILTNKVFSQIASELSPKSLTLPRLSTIEQNTLPPQQAGNIIFNSDEKKLALHDGNTWNYLAASQVATSDFKNHLTFTENGTWTVPAGVTYIKVELWGAGGDGQSITTAGANVSCEGGGGGEYSRYGFAVTPNDEMTINFVRGENRGSYFGRIGGGIDAFAYNASQSEGGSGAWLFYTNGLEASVPGEHGGSAVFNFQSVSSSVWRKIVQSGVGGGTYPSFKNGGKSSTIEFEVPSGAYVGKSESRKNGFVPGGGGACAYLGGGYGGFGVIIVHF
ncbi:hypothetical protein EMA8858_04033 [Emticicia aquatica]|uniref:Uncharacterized protein n=1 Tax=Emticicia aquatica TaxID=1681835 RepID=A0ABN8EXR4_9BACT|nr:hypothetical protein [Emticicia aquatica]CAH0997898.1 hypothetical protein EMA8858_04033 [Emticicia aquatica]